MTKKQEQIIMEETTEETETKEQTPKKQDKNIKEEDVTTIPGVGAATAEKLVSSGHDSLLSIAVTSPKELVEVAGVTEATARKMIQYARDKLDLGFESGTDVLKRRETIEKIKSGSQALDTLLGGGFETRAITEAFASYGSGKTQIGHALATNCLKQYPESHVVYIDTESTFRPERIASIANGLDMNPQEALSRIKIARAYNSDHQVILAEKVDELIKQGLNIKLVIVDSLTAHFRAEFIGRGTLADRQQKINKHLHALMKLAEIHNLAVYVTNQVMSKPDVFFGDPTEAIGGHIVAHASTYRLYLRRGKKGTRVAKLVDSPNLPEAEAAFIVDESGISDV